MRESPVRAMTCIEDTLAAGHLAVHALDPTITYCRVGTAASSRSAKSRSPRHEFLIGWVSRPSLGHMGPLSSIEKPFVLPPDFCAASIYLLLAI